MTYRKTPAEIAWDTLSPDDKLKGLQEAQRKGIMVRDELGVWRLTEQARKMAAESDEGLEALESLVDRGEDEPLQ